MKYLQLHILHFLKYKLKQQIVIRVNSKGLKSINHKHQTPAVRMYVVLDRCC
jgi:hypothetical protein